MRITDVPVSVEIGTLMMTLASASIVSEVASIACGPIVTGTHLSAVAPPGSGHVVVSSPMTDGIAPVMYMQASFSGVAGLQSGASNDALSTAPVVPVIFIPARF